MGRFLLQAAVGAVVLSLVSGCGKKTPPVPPQAAVPAAVVGLSYDLDPEGVTLAWDWPLSTEKGAELKQVKQFVVERAEERLSDFCPDCPRRYRQAGLVEGGAVPDQQLAKPLVFRDRNLRVGFHYTYRVRGSMGWRVLSAPSEPVAFAWQVGVTPPENLTVSPGEKEVTLAWVPPERDLEGAVLDEPLSFQVFRRQSGQLFRLLADIHGESGYVDRRVQSGVTYEYKVRATRQSGGTGAFSPVQAATPIDQTPPPVPAGLTAVTAGDEVRLYWQPLGCDDLAGYRIFRRRQVAGSADQPVLIGEVESRVNSFSDQTPSSPGGEVRYYSLRSFDRAVPPNVSELSPEIAISTKAMTP